MGMPGDRLRAVVDDLESCEAAVRLCDREERLLRSLRTQGERFISGRLITRHRYEARRRPGGVDLVMEMEGRHSMSVAQQLANQFTMVEDVGSAEVTRTSRGAVVALRARERA